VAGWGQREDTQASWTRGKAPDYVVAVSAAAEGAACDPTRGTCCFFPSVLFWGAVSGSLFSEAEDSDASGALQTQE